jgi:hypothetical protein
MRRSPRNRSTDQVTGSPSRPKGTMNATTAHVERIGFLGTLLLTLSEQMKESPIGGPQTSNKPYFVHPTRIVNRFTQEIVFTYARLFQEILGFAKRGYLPPEQIKLGYAIVKLLKISWGAANLEREPSIWQKEYRVGRKNDGPLVLGIVPHEHF